MSRPRRWIGRVALAAVAACSDAERPRYVTEHIDLELYDGEVLCAGTLAAMEGQLQRVATLLDVETPLAHVYYGPSAVEENCATTNGCTRASGVFAIDSSIFHELVHAVRQSQGDGGAVGTWLFEEGLAVVLSGYRWHVQYVLPLASTIERGPAVLADFPRGQDKFVPEDYPTAAHFFSWLRTTYGDAALVAFLNDQRYIGGEQYDEAFVSHFGLSIDDADSVWRASALEEYLWAEICDPAYTLTWEGAVLEFTDAVNCEAPHTTGPSGYTATLRSHCFTLGQAGMLRVEFIANGGRLRLMPVDCVDTDELAPEFYDYKPLDGGDIHELPFAGCTWEVEVDGVTKYPLDFTLRLTRL